MMRSFLTVCPSQVVRAISRVDGGAALGCKTSSSNFKHNLASVSTYLVIHRCYRCYTSPQELSSTVDPL